MAPDDWFTQLRAALLAEVPAVADDERDALLDLARVAAHTSERWAAPVSTFLAGIAYAALPVDARTERLRALVAQLDPDGTEHGVAPSGSA